MQDQSTALLSFVYDADGNRLIERNTATGETTLHLGSTELSWSASAPGSGFTSRRFYSIGDETVAVMEQDETTFRFADHQGTPVLSISGDDHGIEKRRFDPFGGLLEGPETDDPWLVDPTFDERGFLGKRTDALSRTYHLDAREYDPQLGRFISVDPLMDPMDPQQMNGYAYASNSPITFMDPTGLFDWSRYWKRQQTLQKNANSGRTTSPSGVANPSAPQAVVVGTGPNGNLVAVTVSQFDPLFVNLAEKSGASAYFCTEGDLVGGCGGAILYGGVAFAEMYFLSRVKLATAGPRFAWNGVQKVGPVASWTWGQAKSGVGWAGSKAKGGLSWIGGKIGLGSKTVQTTGQIHHVISRKVARELDDHPSLKGKYSARDSRLTTQAVDDTAHRGYQTWHRELDDEVVGWLQANTSATTKQFEVYLRGVYSRPDLKAKFPNGF